MKKKDKKLTIDMLSSAELVEITQIVNRINKPTFSDLRDKELEKAVRPKGIFFPIGVVRHLATAMYYNIRELALWSGLDEESIAEVKKTMKQYDNFYKNVCKKNNCTAIDYDSFPPQLIPFNIFNIEQ